MRRHSHQRRGGALLEFTFVGIPLVFTLISIFEISRGMWAYHTLASAVREGVWFAVVHGENCAVAPNSCRVTVGQVAQRIRDLGVGLLPDQLNVTIRSLTRTINCNPLENCLADTNNFPSSGSGGLPGATPDMGASVGTPITIEARYPFRSAIAMFWPGGGRGIVFGTFTFAASSTENVHF